MIHATRSTAVSTAIAALSVVLFSGCAIESDTSTTYYLTEYPEPSQSASRLDIADILDMNQESLDLIQAVIGDSWGGMWTDRKELLYVGITDRSKLKDLRTLHLPRPAVIVIVSYTETDLYAAFSQASDAVNKYPELVGLSSHIDYPTNSVYVSVPSAEAQLDILNDPKTQSESPQPRTIEQIRRDIQHLLQDLNEINQSFNNQQNSHPILSINKEGIPAIPSDVSDSSSS